MERNSIENTFIPNEGLLNSQVLVALNHPSKRTRQTTFRRLSGVVKALGLVRGEVRHLALSVNYLGETGLLVVTSPTPIEPTNRVTTGGV